MEFDVEKYYENTHRGLVQWRPTVGQIEHRCPCDSFDAAHPSEWWYVEWDGTRWVNLGNTKVLEKAYEAQKKQIRLHPKHHSRMTSDELLGRNK